ncbi:MAG: redoxin domain-containing protein [Anaerolineae bacterium]|nr:redoxin domain-containing protein [Anaerolineae bacterium]
MEGNDVTIGLAFVAGLISFISPCVLPLVPAYVGYMGGRMTKQAASEDTPSALRRRFGTFTHGVFFVLGFTLFFVFFGLLTTAAVSSLTAFGVTEGEVRDGIARVGGTAVILFGLHIMGFLNRVFSWLLKHTARLDKNPYGNLISALIGIVLIGVTYWLFVESWFLTLLAVLIFTQVFRDALKTDKPGEFWSRVMLSIQASLYADTRRQDQPQQDRYGYFGSLFMGVVFSAGWTPCIGPIYGAVLTLASSGESITRAGTLLTVYSLGLGIPFLLTALALDQAQGVFRRLQRNMRTIELFSGVFLILVGVLVFSGQLERLSSLGGEGELGDISLNLENCSVGFFEGKVRLRNVPDCISDGPKEDFYIAVDKNTNSTATDITFSETPDSAPGSGDGLDGGLDVPDLGSVPPGEDTDTLSVPDLSAPGDTVEEGLEVGQRAPNFTAQTPDGRMVSLADYRGKIVLVNFWATWCGPCREEMPDFQTVYDLHKSDNFVVLAVNNMERADDVIPFIDDLGITFPVVLDEAGRINGALYGSRITGYPTSFLLDADGVIVEYFSGTMDGTQLLDALEPLLQD